MRSIYTIISEVKTQGNLSKPILFGINLCVRNRQVALCIYVKFTLYICNLNLNIELLRFLMSKKTIN